jgi:hypothetical protein
LACSTFRLPEGFIKASQVSWPKLVGFCFLRGTGLVFCEGHPFLMSHVKKDSFVFQLFLWNCPPCSIAAWK